VPDLETMANILDRFEQSVEHLFEGTIGRIFRSPIQPAEIGRRLERAMTDGQRVSVDATIVPNDYRVALHPDDFVQFADYIASLCRHMETWVTDLAAERRYTLIDRARVQIAGDTGVPKRSIRVQAAIADRPGMDRDKQDAVQRTEVYRVLRATTGIPPLRLRIASGPDAGKELFVRKASTTMGRALDNDMIFEAGEVSRYHARLDYVDNAYHLTDLGSTNGTKVNGVTVGASPIIAGDEIALGTLRIAVMPFEDEGRRARRAG
jgi:hypothetical protein